MFGKLKLDPADIVFSEYVRRRDGKCMRCKKPGHGDRGIDGLQCSHFFGRGRETTRFDPENCDALCWGCHEFWGSQDRESYREFKIRQLGEERFKALAIRARLTGRKDRKLELIKARELLKTL